MKVSVQLERALRPLFLRNLRRTMSAGGNPAFVPVRNVRAFFSVVTNASGPVGKMYNYDGVELRKQTLAQIYDGEVRLREVTTLEEFLAIRKKLTVAQALCFGVPRGGSRVRIAQQGSPAVLAGEAVARDREHFHFAERPGIFFTDYDPQPDVPPLSWKELDTIYASVIPDWCRTKRAWVPSSSAYIYDKDGVELKGSRGWRCYMLVDRAASIPDLLAYLYQGLWERGHGLVTFAKDGHRLDRSLVDAVTGQPERLDFVAAVLADGLVCKAPPPKILKGRLGMLPTAKLLPAQTMQEWRKSNEKLTAARAAAIPESDRINADFVDFQVHREVARGGDLQAAKRKWQQATRGGTLGGDFEITLSDGAKISVLEILSDPERWHGTRCNDPVAPDRYDDERIGVIYALDRNLFSHAHQTTYRLDTRIDKVTYTIARLDLTTDHMIRALTRHPHIFERGEDVETELVKRVGLSIVPYSAETLQDELRRLVETVHWVRTRGGGLEERPKDPPLTLSRTILAKPDRVGFRKLDAIITAPTLRLDGSLLAEPGYDARTGLFYAPDGDFPEIEEKPDAATIKAAIKTLFAPVSLYQFANDDDKATYFAAVLTAVLRRMFSLAPGFMGDAALGRTGKTKLLQVVAMMAARPALLTVSPYTGDNEETRKSITAGLRSGAPVLFTDNVVGTMRSSAWEAVLTAPGGVWSDRILGESRKASYKTNALMLFTGNNCVLADNLCERILTIKIITEDEEPHLRQFDFDPVEVASETRPQMIAAALTLLRGFISAGKPRQTADRLGSFEQWDSLIRQCVIWLGLGDPIANIGRMRAHDPDSDRLLQFLTAVWQLKGSEPWTVAEIREMARYRDGLSEVVESIAPNARSISNMLGSWLREKRDGWKGGMRIVEAGHNRGNVRRWRIEGRPEEALERENFDLEAEKRRENEELMRSYGENVDLSAKKSKK